MQNLEVKDIRDLSFAELSAHLRDQNEPAYRVRQIFEWLYKKCVGSFDEMTNLSGAFRDKLKKDFRFDAVKVIREEVAEDSTRKALFELNDKEKIETVLIPTDTRATVCVSTQAGCKFGCRFCASGIGGWNRNLKPSEILGQILYMKKKAQGRPLSHLVFMGVGEPLTTLKYSRLLNF